MTLSFLYPALITILSGFLLIYFGIRESMARRKYDVPLPKMSGDPGFERAHRVHANTMEQVLIFFPALWIFSYTVSPLWSAILGGVWIVGRLVYAHAYYVDEKKRGIGFGITALASYPLLIGSLIGIIMALIAKLSG
ncbi:MAG TPA: MAPEG domain-containing protein [Myxococcales bacterium]|nr:MAPEG domain-containing protein [Deltaproteobacteria bacterium]HAA59149.1 MAPEG domain-containing protein [Myxococcales bacterium]|tara:strand:+ start:1447 stop:1857 length:411 start_codon:yes stop_codon:yes gene_type:complete